MGGARRVLSDHWLFSRAAKDDSYPTQLWFDQRAGAEEAKEAKKGT
jgi:hypothetical protein